jgi:hypothetical protein
MGHHRILECLTVLFSRSRGPGARFKVQIRANLAGSTEASSRPTLHIFIHQAHIIAHGAALTFQVDQACGLEFESPWGRDTFCFCFLAIPASNARPTFFPRIFSALQGRWITSLIQNDLWYHGQEVEKGSADHSCGCAGGGEGHAKRETYEEISASVVNRYRRFATRKRQEQDISR